MEKVKFERKQDINIEIAKDIITIEFVSKNKNNKISLKIDDIKSILNYSSISRLGYKFKTNNLLVVFLNSLIFIKDFNTGKYIIFNQNELLKIINIIERDYKI